MTLCCNCLAQKAFQETLLPGYERHSELQETLNKAEGNSVYAPYGANPTNKVKCAACDFRWASEDAKSRALRKKRHNCWATRDKLWAPLRTGQSPNVPPAGILFTTETNGKQVTGVVVDNNEAYDISKPTPQRLSEKFWHGLKLKYQLETDNPKLYRTNSKRVAHALKLHEKVQSVLKQLLFVRESYYLWLTV